MKNTKKALLLRYYTSNLFTKLGSIFKTIFYGVYVLDICHL